MKADIGIAAKRAVVAVGKGGRGFVIETQSNRFVITAAHCLPDLPTPHPWASDTRVFRLLAPLGEKRKIVTECLFVDPVSDIAVLGSPDNQKLSNEADAYEALIKTTAALPIGCLAPKMFAELAGWILSLDGKWLRCVVSYHNDSGLWVVDVAQVIVGGMSGSPILAENGSAIGVMSCSNAGGKEGGPNPRLSHHLPGWLLRVVSSRGVRSRMSARGKGIFARGRSGG